MLPESCNAFELRLVPPTANRIWSTMPMAPEANGRARARMVRSREYRKWIAEAEIDLSYQRGHLTGPFVAIISVDNTHRGDLDNYSKATIDSLVRASKTSDDKKMSGHVSIWGDHSGIRIWLVPVKSKSDSTDVIDVIRKISEIMMIRNIGPSGRPLDLTSRQ